MQANEHPHILKGRLVVGSSRQSASSRHPCSLVCLVFLKKLFWRDAIDVHSQTGPVWTDTILPPNNNNKCMSSQSVSMFTRNKNNFFFFLLVASTKIQGKSRKQEKKMQQQQINSLVSVKIHNNNKKKKQKKIEQKIFGKHFQGYPYRNC